MRVYKIAKKVQLFVISVRPPSFLSARKHSGPTGRIFIKFGMWGLFENLSRKFRFH